MCRGALTKLKMVISYRLGIISIYCLSIHHGIGYIVDFNLSDFEYSFSLNVSIHAIFVSPSFPISFSFLLSAAKIIDSLCSDFSHTKGHVSYYVTGKEGEDPAVFTGDTLVSQNH